MVHKETTARGIYVLGTSVLVSAAIGEPFWILPGGHVDPGETPEQAVCREWQEELGVTITRVTPVGTVQAQWRRGGLLQGTLVQETLHLFWVRDTLSFQEGVFSGREAQLRFRWVPSGELLTQYVVPLEAFHAIVRVIGAVTHG